MPRFQNSGWMMEGESVCVIFFMVRLLFCLFFVGDFLMDSTMVSRHENNPTLGNIFGFVSNHPTSKSPRYGSSPRWFIGFFFFQKKTPRKWSCFRFAHLRNVVKKQWQVKANQGGGNVFFFFRRWRWIFPGDKFWWGNEVWIFFFSLKS